MDRSVYNVTKEPPFLYHDLFVPSFRYILCFQEPIEKYLYCRNDYIRGLFHLYHSAIPSKDVTIFHLIYGDSISFDPFFTTIISALKFWTFLIFAISNLNFSCSNRSFMLVESVFSLVDRAFPVRLLNFSEKLYTIFNYYTIAVQKLRITKYYKQCISRSYSYFKNYDEIST